MRYLPEDLSSQFRNQVLIGTDEVGCGCVAGPVVAAACIINPYDPFFNTVDDSKSFGARSGRHIRHDLAIGVMRRTPYTAVIARGPERVDRIGARKAANECMEEACIRVAKLWARSCGSDPRELLAIIDGNEILDLGVPSRPIPKADTKYACVASASILAKDFRDRLMVAYDPLWPEYGFAQHVGYPTPHHIEILTRRGPCPIHHPHRVQRTVRHHREKLTASADPRLG